MSEYQRKVSEIIAMAELEPGLKGIYVEGLSDYYLISNFLKYHKKVDVGIYLIDDVDFSEDYVGLTKDQIELYQKSNKERVVLLSTDLEAKVHNKNLPIRCLVDRDWDFVTNNVRKGNYLLYTDYNSMELYLFDYEVVDRFLKQGHRIIKAKTKNLLDSLSKVCRQYFHIHCITNAEFETRVGNDKDFSFNKTTYTCTLNFDSFWQKTMMKCNLTTKSKELLLKYNERVSVKCDAREEIRGHDFVHYLYLCVKRIKDSLHMDEGEFANVFWQYINLDKLPQEPLFSKFLAL